MPYTMAVTSNMRLKKISTIPKRTKNTSLDFIIGI